LHYEDNENREVVMKYLNKDCDFLNRIPSNRPGYYLPICFISYLLFITLIRILFVDPAFIRMLFGWDYRDKLKITLAISLGPFVFCLLVTIIAMLSDPGALKND